MSTRLADIRESLIRRARIRRTILTAATLVLAVLALVSVSIGSARLSLGEVWDSLKAGLSGCRPESLSLGKFSVVWDIRLPRIVMALFAGMSLSISGTAMQGIMRNPLVSPYTLGISAASAFGASLAIIFDVPGLIIPAAFSASLASLTMVMFFARKGRMRAEGLILAGIAVMYVFSAGTSLLQYLASHDQLAKIVFWLMGSLSSTTWSRALIVALVSMAAAPVLYSLSWQLNILSSGEDAARSLGVNPRSIRFAVIVTVTLVTAIIVSFTGVIGFIGLAAPHMARLLLGSDHRLLFPASALTGAFFLMVSDTLARTLLGNTELPIGIITSFLGVPFLVSILMSRRKIRRAP